MSNRLREVCPNCATPFESLVDKVCSHCGRIRDEAEGAEVVGCEVASYRVVLSDGTTIGPIPFSAIVAMIKTQVLSLDNPIYEMDTGRCFFPDEHPLLKLRLEI